MSGARDLYGWRLAAWAGMEYLLDMNKEPAPKVSEIAVDKLALAQRAFREFHARCFWFMRPEAIITSEDVPYICQRLRADGGRRGFQIAAELCR